MRAVLATLLVAWSLPATAQPPAAPPDPEELQVLRVLQHIEFGAGDQRPRGVAVAHLANADPDAAGEFFDAAVPRGVTRAVVRERDRVPLDGALPGDGYRMVVEVFVESGPRGQLSTWRLDIRRPAGIGRRRRRDPTRRGGSSRTTGCRRSTRCTAWRSIASATTRRRTS